MKVFRKVLYIIIFLLAFFAQLTIPVFNANVEAKSKTLRTLKAELASAEKDYAENKKVQQATQSQINSANQKMHSIAREKVNIEQEIDDLTKEIEQLNLDIIDMNKEIKDIINFYQLSSSVSSAEMEYFFDSKDFTDFIYRIAISEQLSEYNKEKIDQYNDKINQNENTKKELAAKKKELSSKEVELEKYTSAQRALLSKSQEGALSIEQEMAALKKTIKLYEETYKCKLDETLEECTAGKIPAGSVLYRPIKSGVVTSNYGGRSYKLNGRWTSDFHYGVDFSGPYKTPVYSAGNGVVAAVFSRSSCGGNMVYINHVINGVKYTTGYYHLASYNVKVGEVVTYDSIIGYQGGTSKESWDSCSTGTHVHFTVSTGNWGVTFKNYSGFISKNINPRKAVNIPALGKSFSNRYTKY